MKIDELTLELQARLDKQEPDVFHVSIVEILDRPLFEIRVKDATKVNFFYRFSIDLEYLAETKFITDYLDRLTEGLILDRLKGNHLV